tara:strand:+ start:313 stop:498 length:186 start_codon:yes stop_codon:yes gene_type:complete
MRKWVLGDHPLPKIAAKPQTNQSLNGPRIEAHLSIAGELPLFGRVFEGLDAEDEEEKGISP